jgi:Fe2+ or Zn2+ uptake regulation protein
MSEQFGEKDLMVLQYIKDNSGVTKEALINGLKGKYSRVTIFNALKNLQKQKIINVEKDNFNSQIHHLFVNNDNLIANQLNKVDDFEKIFIPLLERIKEEVSKFYPIMTNQLESYHDLQQAEAMQDFSRIVKGSEFKKIIEPYTLRSLMFVECIRIFRQLLQAYIIHSTCIWPFEIKDRKKLDQLTSILFNRLVNIQLKMSKIISETSLFEASQPANYKISFLPTRSDIVRVMYEALGGWNDLELALKYFKKFGLEKEAEPVVKSLWEIRNEIQKLS